VGGNFYALNAANGQRLWGQKIGGGVITYTVSGAQKVALTTGPIWPVEITTGKIAILASRALRRANSQRLLPRRGNRFDRA
jgi:alcohol dehydrogenase (cytochrome c)